MRTWRILAALILLWTFLPGTGEVVENVDHLVEHGHLAHSAAASHEHRGPFSEHGCTGAFHLCSCHPTLLASVTPWFEVQPRHRGGVRATGEETPTTLPGFGAGPDQPPRA